MRSAFEDLEQTITKQDSKDFQTSTLTRVRQEALDIENKLAARQQLRNMRRLMPLFTALEHYSGVVDILCNGTPFLPWIWAPITLVLRIASEYVEAFDSIIGAYSRIASSIPRFEILERTLAGRGKFHETLAVFYANILEFHKYAYKFVRRSGQSPITQEQYQLTQMRTLLTLDVRMETPLCHILGTIPTALRQHHGKSEALRRSDRSRGECLQYRGCTANVSGYLDLERGKS